jgi:hypothetical protein
MTDTPQIRTNICIFCEVECGSFAYREGACTFCVNLLQTKGWKFIINRLIEAKIHNKELCQENERLELKRKVK